MAVRDATWEVDLLWRYLYETVTPTGDTGQWFKLMDPAGVLNNRRAVYEMLTEKEEHTRPNAVELPKSMIPWNQLNGGLVKTFKTTLACGSVVKLSFMKYMRWGSGEQKRRSVSHKAWNAVQWVVRSLRAGMPVRCYLKKKTHYVGIVGCRGRKVHWDAPDGDAYKYWEFLVMDPWAGGAATGGNTIRYGGGITKFLGIAKQLGSGITYDNHEITDVEGPFPF